MTLLELDFMRRGLLAAVVVGLAAPAIGTFIVQRRLALLGDGLGHMAVTGVAVGFLTRTSPLVTALVVAAVSAVGLEMLRERGHTAGDVALAILFYGGIAGGVFLTSLSPVGGGSLLSYLFGSVLTVDQGELIGIAGLCTLVLIALAVLGKQLFAVCYDEEVARASGLRVRGLNMSLAVISAVTVVVAMRVVGLLLVAALMVIPVAAAQSLSWSFRSTVFWGMGLGVVATILGLVVAFYADASPGATIVLAALVLYLLSSVKRLIW
ncbi:MAG: metal ABC transporter permease [Actinomycetota bacterium]|nr:metal ABC transporter permease [Actinomycetota bacterium]